MLQEKMVILAATLLLAIFIGSFVFVIGTFGQNTSTSTNQIGRYSVAVDEEHAYLLDTVTGCVWRRTAQLPFILMSVEGILEVPPHPLDTETASRKIPEKCR